MKVLVGRGDAGRAVRSLTALAGDFLDGEAGGDERRFSWLSLTCCSLVFFFGEDLPKNGRTIEDGGSRWHLLERKMINPSAVSSSDTSTEFRLQRYFYLQCVVRTCIVWLC